MKINSLIILALLLPISGCTLVPFQCMLKFADYEKTYEFDFSKEELKNRIVEAYTYDRSLLSKNLGLTLIQNEAINSEYRKSIEVWLKKQNWDNVKSEIRNDTSDTLNLLIKKHHSRKQIKLLAIIDGDSQKSSLKIMDIEYLRKKSCNKEDDYYKLRVNNKIDKKLIKELK